MRYGIRDLSGLKAGIEAFSFLSYIFKRMNIKIFYCQKLVIWLPNFSNADSATWGGLLRFPYANNSIPGFISFYSWYPHLNPRWRLKQIHAILMKNSQHRWSLLPPLIKVILLESALVGQQDTWINWKLNKFLPETLDNDGSGQDALNGHDISCLIVSFHKTPVFKK